MQFSRIPRIRLLSLTFSVNGSLIDRGRELADTKTSRKLGPTRYRKGLWDRLERQHGGGGGWKSDDKSESSFNRK